MNWKAILLWICFFILGFFFLLASVNEPDTHITDEWKANLFCERMEKTYWTWINYENMTDIDYTLSECQALSNNLDLCLKEEVGSEGWQRCLRHHEMNVENVLNIMNNN